MTENRATDTRPPFFSIEESVIDDYDLNPLEGWLYVVIVRYINRKKNDAFPSIMTLAKTAKMSRASVFRCTTALEEKGLIEVRRETEPGKKENAVNHYRLLIATKVVSDSNHLPTEGGNLQQPQVVSDSNSNQKVFNQSKDSASQNDAGTAVEITTLSPEKAKRSAAAKAPPSSATPSPKPRDPIFDAVALYIFETSDPNATGGRIAKIASWLEGKNEGKGKDKLGFISKPATPEHIRAFAGWCKAKGITPPYDLVKFVENWRAWAQQANGHGSGNHAVTPDVPQPITRTPAQLAALREKVTL